MMAEAIRNRDSKRMQDCVCTAIKDAFNKRADELVEYIKAGEKLDPMMKELLRRSGGGGEREKIRDREHMISLMVKHNN